MRLACGGLGPSVWAAAARSLGVAAVATVLALALAGAIATAAAASRRLATPVETVAYLAVAVSPLVLGTGLFVLLFPVADPVRLALPVTAVANAVAALPFAVRVLAPALATVEADYGRLADSLGMRGAARLRHLWLPRLRRPLGFAAGLAAALSIGDLGVVALFADPAPRDAAAQDVRTDGGLPDGRCGGSCAAAAGAGARRLLALRPRGSGRC